MGRLTCCRSHGADGNITIGRHGEATLAVIPTMHETDFRSGNIQLENLGIGKSGALVNTVMNIREIS